MLILTIFLSRLGGGQCAHSVVLGRPQVSPQADQVILDFLWTSLLRIAISLAQRYGQGAFGELRRCDVWRCLVGGEDVLTLGCPHDTLVIATAPAVLAGPSLTSSFSQNEAALTTHSDAAPEAHNQYASAKLASLEPCAPPCLRRPQQLEDSLRWCLLVVQVQRRKCQVCLWD